MKKTLATFVVVLTSISMLGCTAEMNNQDVGTVTGGVLGGIIGSRFGGGTGRLVAVGAGTLLGAYIGNSLGKSMDDADRVRMYRALENNPAGQPAYWANDRTGATYTVVPVRNVTFQGNRYCREYRTTANIAGRKQQVYGTACRNPDGTWQAMNA